jgi:hypothetical protein
VPSIDSASAMVAIRAGEVPNGWLIGILTAPGSRQS